MDGGKDRECGGLDEPSDYASFKEVPPLRDLYKPYLFYIYSRQVSSYVETKGGNDAYIELN